jgi:DNA-binding response OmpR family regulator
MKTVAGWVRAWGIARMVFCLVVDFEIGIIQNGTEFAKNARLLCESGRYPASVSRKKDEDLRMKRRILLVDDELAILLTLKAVLEISGFEVETAASAREAKLKIRTSQYHMVITDMRMESDFAGNEVVHAARKAPYQPAVAMLTAFPIADSESDGPNPDKMLVKPMNTNDLLRQLEALLVTHEDKKRKAEAGHAQFAAELSAPGARKSAATSKKKVQAKKLAPAR